MRKLKIIAAEVVQGRSPWLVLTFEDYPRQLCVNYSRGYGRTYLDATFGHVEFFSELVGREVLLAELPRRSNDYLYWETMEPAAEVAAPSLAPRRSRGTAKESSRWQLS